MRALGVQSDKSIIEYCLLDLEKNSDYVDFFIPSVHDANRIFCQKTVLEFIATFTKRQTVSAVLDILMNYFLPHIGENNFLDKAYYIGFMVNKILILVMIIFVINHLMEGQILNTIKGFFTTCNDKTEKFIGNVYLYQLNKIWQ